MRKEPRAAGANLRDIPESDSQGTALDPARADDVDLNRDCRLVERFQSGDRAAFDDLYRRYYARLVRYCAHRVGDPHEAEEIAQEAFARAYRALPRLAGERRFYPWMTVIASRLCVDTHRRRARVEPADVIDLGAVEPDLDGIFAAVDRDHVAQALARLAPRHRDVLQRRERDGWTTQQIADHYAISVGSVEALLHRARRSLRRQFLSIAGGGGGWAGVPLLGAVGRRMVAARDRVTAWAAQVGDVATPLAAKVGAIAFAVGSTAIAGSAVAGGAAATPLPVAAVASIPVAAHSAAPAPVTPAASGVTTASANRANPAVSPRGRADSPAIGPSGGAFADAAHGRRAASGAPVRAEGAGTGAAVDPSAIGAQVGASVQPIVEGLP